MDINLFDFYLPEELIAQVPLKDRASSRLMSIDRMSGELSHLSFKDVISKLKKGDCLVLNDTRVIPARLYGAKKTGAAMEVVLLHRVESDNPDDILWEVILTLTGFILMIY